MSKPAAHFAAKSTRPASSRFAKDPTPKISTSAPPSLAWINIDSMRPTQCCVGMIEVAHKTRELRQRSANPAELAKYLASHPIPAVLGPDLHLYLTDHHHMGLAMIRLARQWDEADKPAAQNPFRNGCFHIIKDYSNRSEMTMSQFRSKIEAAGLCHPYDAHGKRAQTLPRSLAELSDDPYRSLAGLARKAGAYDKVRTPYSEFRWADFFREKVPREMIVLDTLAQAIALAIDWAHDPSASALPGFHGDFKKIKTPTLDDIAFRLKNRFGASDEDPDLPPVPASNSKKIAKATPQALKA